MLVVGSQRVKSLEEINKTKQNKNQKRKEKRSRSFEKRILWLKYFITELTKC